MSPSPTYSLDAPPLCLCGHVPLLVIENQVTENQSIKHYKLNLMTNVS